jgi:hypothetical protein
MSDHGWFIFLLETLQIVNELEEMIQNGDSDKTGNIEKE